MGSIPIGPTTKHAFPSQEGVFLFCMTPIRFQASFNLNKNPLQTGGEDYHTLHSIPGAKDTSEALSAAGPQ